MRSKLIAAAASVVAFAVPATAMASGSTQEGGSGGNGQAQLAEQAAQTEQEAISKAKAEQNAVNTNAPVNVAGGDVSGGNNSANQTASNGAGSSSGNNASTSQSNSQSQSDPSSCQMGCGGNGQAQLSYQAALTEQEAYSKASANQNAVNANVPVNIAGGDVSGGSNSANQTASNGAGSSSSNNASTSQSGEQSQSS